jgi:tRNA pseudouridine38-40 synthase
MYRYFLEVQYNGLAFCGSQIQVGLKTVQGSINTLLTTLLRQPIETFGASRTDEGVHALCNVYHFDVAELLDVDKISYRLNGMSDPNLAFTRLYLVPNDANARFDAISRQYRYKIYFKKNPFYHERALFFPYTIDKELLVAFASVLKEYKDFTTFSKKNTQTYTNLCTIFESKWEFYEDQMHYIVTANRFLRGMVRALVGTQLRAARSQKTLSDFKAIIEAMDCSKADFSVTGNGLYLEQINYPSYAVNF